jgi:hypothetical protein
MWRLSGDSRNTQSETIKNLQRLKKKGGLKHTTNLYKAFKTLRDTCRDAKLCAACRLGRLDGEGGYKCVLYEMAKASDPEDWDIEEL